MRLQLVPNNPAHTEELHLPCGTLAVAPVAIRRGKWHLMEEDASLTLCGREPYRLASRVRVLPRAEVCAFCRAELKEEENHE